MGIGLAGPVSDPRGHADLRKAGDTSKSRNYILSRRVLINRLFSAPCSDNNSDVSLHRSPGTGQGRRHTVYAR